MSALPSRRQFQLQLRERRLQLGTRTLLMGILNVTPDSFSEQGTYFDRKAAIERGLEIEAEGAGILDVGGESTRPGATPVAPEEEMDRTIPVIEALRRKKLRIPISIDTYKAAVAERALRAGAEIVNDVSGLRYDRQLACVIGKYRAAAVLMHIRGTPQTMQELPPVRDVVEAVRRGLAVSIRNALAAGIRSRQIVIDPGIGFGKSAEQNFQLIRALPRLADLGYPLLVGPSRKSFVKRELVPSAGSPGAVDIELLRFGTAAAVAACILAGAHIIRVHDVRQMAAVARVADRLRRP